MRFFLNNEERKGGQEEKCAFFREEGGKEKEALDLERVRRGGGREGEREDADCDR